MTDKFITDKGNLSGIKDNKTELKYQGSVEIEGSKKQFIVATVQYGDKGSATGLYQRIGELKPNEQKDNDSKPDYKVNCSVIHRENTGDKWVTSSKYKNVAVWVNESRETKEKYLGVEFSSKDFSDTSPSAPKESWKSEYQKKETVPF